MIAALAIVPLIVIIYLRPQEVVSALQSVPFLYICSGLAAFGLALDLRAGRGNVVFPPQLTWVLAFVVWVLVATVLGAPGSITMYEFTDSIIALILFSLVALCAQSFRALQLTSAAIAFCVLVLIAVGFHQRFAPQGCILLDESNMGVVQTGRPDGRSCTEPAECYGVDAVPGAAYGCEHLGLMGTTSVQGRIRYRGILQDPNELAAAVAVGLPLLFALALVTRRLRWRVLATLGVAVGLAVLIFTQSRSGQMVFLVAVGVYGVQRFGLAAGAGAGLVLALPALLLGGRSGAEATSSTEHRLESWSAGFDMLRSSPVIGVGKGMFVANNFLTAHNSYVLAAAELGIVGYLLWSVIIYLSLKIPFVALRTLRGPDTETARTWALALLASLSGFLVAMLFLSLSYHYVVWIYLGLSGALYTAIVRHRPSFRVRLTLVDGVLIVAGSLGMLLLIAVYLRLKGY